jgi:predicted phage terminase large subunit-like protein
MNDEHSLKALKLEQIARACRKDLLLFAKWMHLDFVSGRHLEILGDALQKVEAGQIHRLMVTMPPRHGKSTMVSQLFPIWCFGRNPKKEVIVTGYGDDIAAFHSRHARRFFASERYSAVFPGVARISDAQELERESVHEWSTLHGGCYRAVGITSGISGRGADLIVIDDVVKNREQASSSELRSKILQEYRSTLYTRLSPGGAIVLVMTRWHPTDLAGTLLAEMAAGGEQWTVLSMPAIDADGNALWPERWSLERLQKVKTAIGSAEFGALYQQNPKMAQGGMFKRQWFEVVQEMPETWNRVRYWDRAATEGGGDWTCGLRMSRDKDGIYFVEDIVRLQGSPMQVEQAILATAKRDGTDVRIFLERDPGAAGVMEVDYYIRQLAGYSVYAVPVTQSKTLRAGPVASQTEAGHVKLFNASWVEKLLCEAEDFPNGDHDDIIDCLSGAFGQLINYNPIWFAV